MYEIKNKDRVNKIKGEIKIAQGYLKRVTE